MYLVSLLYIHIHPYLRSSSLLGLGLGLGLGHDHRQEDIQEEQAEHDIDAQVVDCLDRSHGLVQLQQIKRHGGKVQGTGGQQPRHHTPRSLGHRVCNAGLASNERIDGAAETDRHAALSLHVHELKTEAEEVSQMSTVPDSQEQEHTQGGQVLVAEEAQALENIELGPEVGVHVEGSDDLGQRGGEFVVQRVDVAEAVPLGLALGVVAVEGDTGEDARSLGNGPDSKVLTRSIQWKK